MAAIFYAEKPRSTALDSSEILKAARNTINRLDQARTTEIKEKSSKATEVIIEMLIKNGESLRQGLRTIWSSAGTTSYKVFYSKKSYDKKR